ncbi:hypothetical protein P7B02_12210 [Caulobacter segnis]|uniref:hypothetical protein n=1 Tax=Caulobacter segnis TaxID=88688 RepID=UPI00240FCE26|nr:hypothetical protein [Caulobacter segnis]MDG2522307.1 hypothetical protein [Caulobacter segnis]
MSDPDEPQGEERGQVPLLLWAMIGVIVVGAVALWLVFGTEKKSVSRTTTIPMTEPQKAPETTRPVQR